MVRLQTLDLRIGVRVPASQPKIPLDFLQIVRFPALKLGYIALSWIGLRAAPNSEKPEGRSFYRNITFFSVDL